MRLLQLDYDVPYIHGSLLEELLHVVFVALSLVERKILKKIPLMARMVHLDGDGYLNNEDCDNDDSNTFPNAVEVCGACLITTAMVKPTKVTEIFYADSDGDGFGSENLQQRKLCEVQKAMC